MFFTYTLFAVVINTTKLLIRHQALSYFYLYWSAEIVYALLGCAALYEAFHRLFRDLHSRRNLNLKFSVATVVLLALCGLWLSLHGLPAHTIPVMRVVLALVFASGILQLGLSALIFFLGKREVHSTRRYGYGITAGFGIAAFGTFASTLIFSEFGTKYKTLLEMVVPLAYFVAVAIWLNAFAWPEPGVPATGPELNPEEELGRVRQSRKDVEEFLEPWLDRLSFRSGSGVP